VSGAASARRVPGGLDAGGKRDPGGRVMEILRRSWQFQHVYQRGKKINCKNAVVFYLRNEEMTDSLCIGVVASKRVGNAVKRTRAKRLLRETSRQLSERLKDRKMWMVFIARSTILETNYHDILLEMEGALSKEGLLAREQ
jgi:ribonuclease P protein component